MRKARAHRAASQSAGLTAIAITCSLISWVLVESALGITANPRPFTARQPDGTRITLRVRGDEYFNWLEDTAGYAVVRDGDRYVYAKLDAQGNLAPTTMLVGKADPRAAGLAPRSLPPADVRKARREAMSAMVAAEAPARVLPTGTVKNLVILCMFEDHQVGVHGRATEDYDVLFNKIGGDPVLAPTGSVKDLFLENSYGAMTLESTVVAWVTLPYTEAYYTNGYYGFGNDPQNAQGMVRDALVLADALVDFSEFDTNADGWVDAIDIIHSGYGAEFDGNLNHIWSHRWAINTWTSREGVKVSDYHTEPALWETSGTDICRIAVIAHETGHFFGLPDLYDTDGSSEGAGSYCMMANSWGFDWSQLHPPHFSAWCKIFLGWVTPTVISTAGVYVAPQVELTPTVFRIDSDYPTDEYLLIENRQPVGIESAMPQGGLAIWHIDDKKGSFAQNNVNNDEGYPGQLGWPQNGRHYRVALLQADGNYDLEMGFNRGDGDDLYHKEGVSLLSKDTVPNTDAYQRGNIVVTDNTISVLTSAGPTMRFAFGKGEIGPMPPVANDLSVTTPMETAVDISLEATDDGLPDPPGQLTYLVMSLPATGRLFDAGKTPPHEITPEDIGTAGYALADNRNVVTYLPNPNQSKPDSFTYKADDGGTAPDGGISNEATVSIEVIGPKIATDPIGLEPETFEGLNAASQTFEVWNSSVATLNYTIASNVAWLTVNPTSGSSTGATRTTINVNYQVAAMPAGTHNAEITISDPVASNDPLTLPVTLTVVGPIVATDPQEISAEAAEGSNAASQTFEVTNVGGGTLRFAVSDDADWLRCTPASGSLAREQSTTVTVAFNNASLASGTYEAAISITDPNAENSPYTLPVRLRVRGAMIELDRTELDNTGERKVRVQGETIAPQTFQVRNSAYGTLRYSVTTSAPWIASFSPASGESTGEWDEITVTYDTTFLNNGLYTGEITVSDPQADVEGNLKTLRVLVEVDYLPALPETVVPHVPATPIDGSASILNGRVVLLWHDMASDEESYIVERKEGDGEWVAIDDALAADTASYTDVGVTAGATYTYRVFAANSAGRSDALTIGPVTVPTILPPPPPPPPPPPDEPDEPVEPTRNLPAAVQYPSGIVRVQPGTVLQLVAVKQADGSVRIALLPSEYITANGIADVLFGTDGVSLPGFEVVWSAAGGRIDSGGRYVAGSAPGEYALLGRVPDMDVYTDSLTLSIEVPPPGPDYNRPPPGDDDTNPPAPLTPVCGAAGAVEWLVLAMCCLLMGRVRVPLTRRDDGGGRRPRTGR